MCTNGHSFGLRDGVPAVVGDALHAQLAPFLAAFSAYRAQRGERITDARVYPQLPEGGLALDQALWRPRVFDLALVRRITGARKNLRVLDIGAWNGWLAHRLAGDGHRVLALDYFTDPFDGLGAVQHYPERFEAMQFDLERLDLLDGPFDLVIANRCAAYFTELPRSIGHMERLLAPAGTLLMTGLNIHGSTRAIEAHFAASRQRFQEQHGLPYLFKPVKGYLTGDDARRIAECGLILRDYPELRWKNLLQALRPSKPRYLYALRRATGAPSRSSTRT